ncbi:MAG: type I restriction enzyme HsdR N-terminal domain-containing protein [Bacteroidales bacterium]|jgi:predicted type IV restriction endonuclease
MFEPKTRNNNTEIFDPVRKKYVKLTPEEFVRQYVIYYLNKEKKIPYSLMGVEKQIKVNNLAKRPDIIVFKPTGDVFLIVECKAPKVKITDETFYQALRYNLTLNSKFFILTNGEHWFCAANINNNIKQISIDEIIF